MNEKLIEKIKDPKFYLENFTRIKGKSGGLIPFKFKEAQKDISNVIRKSNRTMILKARQIGFCLDKSTKILSSSLEWITLEDIKVGQEIVAVDEVTKPGRGNGRKLRKAVVNNKWSIFEKAYRLRMDNGEELIATAQHRFLGKTRGSVSTTWRMVENTKIGDEIRYITKPWDGQSYEDGWFGGMIDGEGHLSKKSRTGARVSVSQVEGSVWERLKKYLSFNGYSYLLEWDKRRSDSSSKFGNRPVGKVIIGRMDELFRLIGQTRPSRFIGRDWWEGKDLPGKCSGIGWSKVVSIEYLGEKEMIDLQTSEKTFIAEGFVSHNSSVITGLFYHGTLMNPGTNTALIGYNSSLTMELLDKIKTFYRTTPKELQPEIKYNSKFEISFPKIDSKILILPSTENVGRGYTLHRVLCTELAFWEKAEEKMVALENSVPENGNIVIESTPNGQGNLFHKMWMTEDNGYEKKEYGWWWEYTPEQIEKIKKRLNNPLKFAQEYDLTFLASGRPVFDQNVLKEQRRNVWKVGEVHKIGDSNDEFKVREEDGWIIYKEPELNKLYICGADVSEGVTGGDYSVAVILDRMTGEEVAMYRGFLPPDRFADTLNTFGRRYNDALMVVEVNNHGLTTITCLKQKIYPSFYFRTNKYETVGAQVTDKLGWQTNKRTKPFLIDDLGQALREHELIIHSKEILDEMSVFVYNENGDMVSQEGFHDDTIMAIAICFQGFKVLYNKALEQVDYRSHLPYNFSY